MKVFCNTEELSKSIVEHFLKAKKDVTHRKQLLLKISISTDKTKMQLKEISNIKKQLLLRQQQGEENLKLVYRRRAPVIISMPVMSTEDGPSLSNNNQVN